jgi:hypothetical protein
MYSASTSKAPRRHRHRPSIALVVVIGVVATAGCGSSSKASSTAASSPSPQGVEYSSSCAPTAFPASPISTRTAASTYPPALTRRRRHSRPRSRHAPACGRAPAARRRRSRWRNRRDSLPTRSAFASTACRTFPIRYLAQAARGSVTTSPPQVSRHGHAGTWNSLKFGATWIGPAVRLALGCGRGDAWCPMGCWLEQSASTASQAATMSR